MPPAVPAGGAQRGAGTPAGQRRADRGEPRRQPRGRPVGHVVEAGRGPAEPLVPRGPVADHGVQGVHRAVGGQAGQPGERGPDQRGDRRVAGVLGHGLHHGAGDVLRAELGGVPAAEPREDRPGRLQIIRVQRHGGPFGFMGKRTGTGDRPDGAVTAAARSSGRLRVRRCAATAGRVAPSTQAPAYSEPRSRSSAYMRASSPRRHGRRRPPGARGAGHRSARPAPRPRPGHLPAPSGVLGAVSRRQCPSPPRPCTATDHRRKRRDVTRLPRITVAARLTHWGGCAGWGGAAGAAGWGGWLGGAG